MPKYIKLLLGIVIAHFLAAIVIGERRLVDYFTVSWFAEIFTVLILPFFIWVLYHCVMAMRLKVKSPIAYIIGLVRKDHVRFRNAALMLVCFAIVNRSYRAIKVSIPRLEPFHLDTFYANLDRSLFGVDPWEITHSLIGPGGTAFIDVSYFLWFNVVLLAFAFSAFSRDPRFQIQSCTVYFLIWILLGNVLAIVMSAAGPCYYEVFYGSDRFAELTSKLSQSNLMATNLQAYLLAVNGDEAIGSGISAMPSLHCALTMYIVILAHHKFGFGWQFGIALIYHLIILVGSVHLGWHYAVDGLFSTLVVPPIWWVARKLLENLDISDKESGPLPSHRDVSHAS